MMTHHMRRDWYHRVGSGDDGTSTQYTPHKQIRSTHPRWLYCTETPNSTGEDCSRAGWAEMMLRISPEMIGACRNISSITLNPPTICHSTNNDDRQLSSTKPIKQSNLHWWAAIERGSTITQNNGNTTKSSRRINRTWSTVSSLFLPSRTTSNSIMCEAGILV